MSDNTGEAAARPEDYVRRFIEALRDPNCLLKTAHHQLASVWSCTSWGDAGRTAILAALEKAATR